MIICDTLGACIVFVCFTLIVGFGGVVMLHTLYFGFDGADVLFGLLVLRCFLEFGGD